MKVGTVLSALCLVAVPSIAAAQSNPFVPSQSSGLSRKQVEEIIRREMAERQAASPDAAAPSGSPTAPGSAPTDQMPSQVAPGGAGTPPVEVEEDPVAALISEGGGFVGCVRDVPIFRDKFGRRVYFTTKELKNSDAIKRYARC